MSNQTDTNTTVLDESTVNYHIVEFDHVIVYFVCFVELIFFLATIIMIVKGYSNDTGADAAKIFFHLLFTLVASMIPFLTLFTIARYDQIDKLTVTYIIHLLCVYGILVLYQFIRICVDGANGRHDIMKSWVMDMCLTLIHTCIFGVIWYRFTHIR